MCKHKFFTFRSVKRIASFTWAKYRSKCYLFCPNECTIQDISTLRCKSVRANAPAVWFIKPENHFGNVDCEHKLVRVKGMHYFFWKINYTIYLVSQFSQNYLLWPQLHIRYSLRICRSNADTILTEKVDSQLTLMQCTVISYFYFMFILYFF